MQTQHYTDPHPAHLPNASTNLSFPVEACKCSVPLPSEAGAPKSETEKGPRPGSSSARKTHLELLEPFHRRCRRSDPSQRQNTRSIRCHVDVRMGSDDIYWCEVADE